MKVRRIVLATVGSLALAGAAWLPATRADATAYCSAKQSGNGATAYCYASASGTQFRAVAKCRIQTSSGSYDYSNSYGAWQKQGDPYNSLATCSTGFSYYSASVQTK